MAKRTFSLFILTLLLVSMMAVALEILPVRAQGTIYIRADGSISPPTANITSVDAVTYTFTDDNYDSIVVERGNIIVDGNGYTLQGSGSGRGFYWTDINNVTIKNTNIRNFRECVVLSLSSNCHISGNNIRNSNWNGVFLGGSSYNVIFGNNIADNVGEGVYLARYQPSINSDHNAIYGNNITNNGGDGVHVNFFCDRNSISRNNITDNVADGVYVDGSGNSIYENRITNNGRGVYAGSDQDIYGNIITNNNGDGVYGLAYNYISGNIITDNDGDGVHLDRYHNYVISGNKIANNGYGLHLSGYYPNKPGCSDNHISENNITNNNWGGVCLNDSYDNTISGNNIAANNEGVCLVNSSDNRLYHNNFDNAEQVHFNTSGCVNVWDDGYPNGGNYWSDLNPKADFRCGPRQDVIGSDGIVDVPYIIDLRNRDHYPLVKPYTTGSLSVSISTDKYTYHAGEEMRLSLNVSNPESVKYLCVAIGVKLPDSSVYVYMHKHSVILPIGLDYANSSFQVITLPNLTPGKYTWYAAFLERATHTIIVKDTAEWKFT